MWMSIRGHFASSTEIKFPIVLNFLKWLISVRAKYEKSAYSRRMLCFKSPTPKITGGWSGIRNSGRPDAKMQVRRYLRWAADGTFYSVGSGTEDTHNRTVTKPRTSATRASDSTGEQCLKQVDGPAGGFFIMAAGVFSPDGTRVIDLIFPPRWLVAAPKKKKQNTAICFRSFSKRMQTLHVARRLTFCYWTILSWFPSRRPKMRPNNLTPWLVTIDDSHHNLLVSSDFSDSAPFPIFFFLKKPFQVHFRGISSAQGSDFWKLFRKKKVTWRDHF